jgi:hypothetical protein
VPRRGKLGGIVECADMKMHFRRGFAFARQGGPAPRAEAAQSAGRRIELRDLPFRYRVSVTPECHEYGNRRTAMLATALAMTPCHAYRVPWRQIAPCRTSTCPQTVCSSCYRLLAQKPVITLSIEVGALRPLPQSASRRPSTPENRLRTDAR